MPGIKGFYTAIRRELRDHLKQWYIAFSNDGCGTVTYNDKVIHNNVCWICHKEYFPDTKIILDGFVAPWCDQRECIDKVTAITPELIEFVRIRNEAVLL